MNHHQKIIQSLCNTYTIKDGMQVYSFSKLLEWLEQTGKTLFHSKFRILEQDQLIIRAMLHYFIRDEAACKKLGIHLHKGIMLTGPVGCGKTSLLTLMKYLLPEKEQFGMKSCREISYNFSQKGYPIIQQLAGIHPFPAKTICFDDLGTENHLKFYGNDCNVMAEILLSRYDVMMRNRTITHITTNLTATELEKMYGSRVRSRLRSMVNLLAFDNHTPDKRT